MSDFISFLTTHFRSILSHRHRGWFAAAMVIGFAIGGLLIYEYYRESPPTLMTLYVGFLSSSLGGCVWIWSMQLPKARRGTVGFGAAFVCDTDSQAQKIRNDFFSKMRSLVTTWHVHNGTDFVVLPSWVAVTLENASAHKRLKLERKYASRSNCHFLIWGRARLRQDNSTVHVLDLHGLVRHQELNESQQKHLSTEFREVFPQRLQVELERDFIGFEVSATSLDLVARYVVAIAAAHSGAFNHAISLLEQLTEALAHREKFDQLAGLLSRRVPNQLKEIRDAKFRYLVRTYSVDRTQESLRRVAEHINTYADMEAHRYEISLMRAMCMFVLDRDIDEARAELQRHVKVTDPSWQMGLAFIDAYQGNLQEAYRRYARIDPGSLSGETLVDVEEFIQLILDQEPHQKQLLFLTGMINHRFKGDTSSARADLRTFVKWARKQSSYRPQVDAADKWIKELKYKR